MKRIFTICIVCIAFCACKPGVPNNVIQPDKMEKVLFDIHTVDGYIGTLQKPDTAKIVASSYYKGIYKKFEIDSAIYTRSLNYYYNHPDILNKIYENLTKQFEEERKRNDKIADDEAKALQRKLLAAKTQALAVPTGLNGPPRFAFTVNPFSFSGLIAIQ